MSNSKLTDILQEMLDEANRSAIAVRKLKNGLTIGIQADTTSYTVILARDDVYPSAKEWETIFRRFPYYCLVPDATQTTTRNGRKALKGRVPKRHIQNLRLL